MSVPERSRGTSAHCERLRTIKIESRDLARTMSSWHEDLVDDPFPEMAREGYHWQCQVLEAFVKRGLRAETEDLRVRPSMSVYHEYGDAGDLFVWSRAGVKHHVAVKSRGKDTRAANFTDTASFPYPDVAVSTPRSWEHAPAVAVVIVSQKTGAKFVVPGKTKPYWILRSLPTKDGPKQVFHCPMTRCRTFEELCRWLEEN